jgi:hypothetical protein
VELSKKLQVPVGTPIFLVGAPKGFDPGVPMVKKAAGAAVLAFAVDSRALPAGAKPAIDAAKEDRLSWVAYPKAGQLGTDLNRDRLARLMEPFGLEPVRLVSVDDTWSAMRFRPKGTGRSR